MTKSKVDFQSTLLTPRSNRFQGGFYDYLEYTQAERDNMTEEEWLVVAAHERG